MAFAKNILATAVAAYITKNAILFKDMAEDKVKHLVGDQLENSVQYFETHPEAEKFFSTSNGMVFHTAQHAANHAQSLKDNIVLPIDRADIAALLAAPVAKATEQEAEEAGTGEATQLNNDADPVQTAETPAAKQKKTKKQ